MTRVHKPGHCSYWKNMKGKERKTEDSKMSKEAITLF